MSSPALHHSVVQCLQVVWTSPNLTYLLVQTFLIPIVFHPRSLQYAIFVAVSLFSKYYTHHRWLLLPPAPYSSLSQHWSTNNYCWLSIYLIVIFRTYSTNKWNSDKVLQEQKGRIKFEISSNKKTSGLDSNLLRLSWSQLIWAYLMHISWLRMK